VKLLAKVERRLGSTNKLAQAFPDRRNTTRTVHSLADMFRAHMFAICCGYEDADDLDRSSAAFKLACWRLPDTGRELCFQPTLSRLENAPRLRDVIRLTSFLVDAWMDSYPRELTCIRMDDTFNVVHGHQQLSLFSAHHDERHFLPIQIYDTERSRPVVVILRSGRAPRCAPILRRLMAHSRAGTISHRNTFSLGKAAPSGLLSLPVDEAPLFVPVVTNLHHSGGGRGRHHCHHDRDRQAGGSCSSRDRFHLAAVYAAGREAAT
jgi:hypothetical protein